MGLAFLNPAFLWGLSFTSIPIIIHLLYRRRFKILRWGAMEFLRLSEKKQQQSLRLEQLLPLLRRCLILALVALAISRPVMNAAGIPLLVWALMKEKTRPSAADWGRNALIGAFPFLGGHGSLAWAELRVPTGLAIEIPPGYDVQVRPRSGLSLKGVGVAFGTIDSDYRGEVLVTMWVFGSRTEHQVRHGDRIAQLVVTRLATVSVEEVDALSGSERGAKGHGSTGS